MARKRSNVAEEEPREPRARQGHLEGLEPPCIPEIEEAAEEYCRARDARMRLNQKESEKKEILDGLMKQHQLKVYEFDGKEVVIEEGQEKLLVRKKKEPKASREDAE